MKIRVDGHEVYAYTGGRPFSADSTSSADPAAAPGALPCVVFLHGALNDHSVWTLLARWCAHHGLRVLALDLPGHGRSGGMPLDSVEALGAWALRVLDAAGVEQAAWVGHSMGSLIALEAAALAPQRASHLLMVGTAYPMKVSPALLETARTRPEVAMEMVTAFSHSLPSAKPSYPGPGAWLRGGAMALMHQVQARQTGCNLFEHDFKVCDAYAGAEAAAARVSCPVSFVLGSLDQMTTPRQTEALAGWLRPQVHLLRAGHALMAEAPDAMLEALRRALRQEPVA